MTASTKLTWTTATTTTTAATKTTLMTTTKTKATTLTTTTTSTTTAADEATQHRANVCHNDHSTEAISTSISGTQTIKNVTCHDVIEFVQDASYVEIYRILLEQVFFSYMHSHQYLETPPTDVPTLTNSHTQCTNRNPPLHVTSMIHTQRFK